ncbi:MAG: hypothetical protein ABSG59_07920 [Verrucomicrobiota bacterium]|jgi:hypothetical protein
MNENQSFSVGPGGRFIVFSGVGMVLIATSMYLLKPLERVAGEKALPYVIVGMVIVNVVLVMFFYGRCPKRLVMPIGIIGWLTAFLLFFLWNWFGPER